MTMYDPAGATNRPSTGTPYQSKSPMQSAPGIGSVFSTDAGGPPADNTGSPSSPGVIGGGFGRRQMRGGAQQPGGIGYVTCNAGNATDISRSKPVANAACQLHGYSRRYAKQPDGPANAAGDGAL